MSVVTTLKAQWDYIFQALQSNMNYGAGGPGTGTNAAGLLQSVASVEQSEWPAFNALPFVGVSLKNWTMQSEYTGPRRKLIAHFEIVAVVDVVAAGTTTIKLADAYAKAMAILDDGAGNGILPILLDPSRYTLGGNASKVIPSAGRNDWADKSGGKGTDYVAYSTVILQIESYVG